MRLSLTYFFINYSVFWDILLAPYSPYVNQRFGGTYLHLQGGKLGEKDASLWLGRIRHQPGYQFFLTLSLAIRITQIL
jgi:hypothetical protein